MKIEDIKEILISFLKQEDSYTSILIDGKWGCGKTTQIRECLKEIDDKNVVYVSLFGVKSSNELSTCYNSLGKAAKIIGEAASVGLSAIPFVGSRISDALSNVLDQYNDSKKIKKKKVFIFDDLERVDESMSLISLLGLFNNLALNNCKILCLSALDELTNVEKKMSFDRFVEKAFDRTYHIDENPNKIFKDIFSKFGVNNIEEISKGFNGNIRLAKRTALLFETIDSKVCLLNDKEHNFYQNFSKEELLNSAMLAIRILYVNSELILFSEEEQKSYTYLLLEEYSNYFGKKISQKFITEFLGKKYVQDCFQKEKLYSLTRDLIFVEMFNNYDYIEQESRVIVASGGDNEYLLNLTFYFLNDKDRFLYFNLLTKSIKEKSISINSALITKIGEICTYSSFAFPDDVIDLLADEIAIQVNSGDNEVFEKAKEHSLCVSSKKSDGVNYVEIIYKKAKAIIDDNNKKIMEQELLDAYHSNNYKFLLDTYYDFAEGKLYSERNNYADFTIKNKFFLPHLEESITHYQWSFCHEIARYCKAADISDDFINHLKAYCKMFPKEESLKDKAFAMVFYNIDSSFKIEDLDCK